MCLCLGSCCLVLLKCPPSPSFFHFCLNNTYTGLKIKPNSLLSLEPSLVTALSPFSHPVLTFSEEKGENRMYALESRGYMTPK